MIYRYPLPARLIEQALRLEEFANGGAQCHIKLRDGSTHPGILVSNATAIIAMRGFKELPFLLEEIESIFQIENDQNPKERGNWDFFDDEKT